MAREGSTWVEAAAAATAALLPLVFGAMGSIAETTASADEATVRILGVGYTGLLHELDALVATPFALVPIGPVALRMTLVATLAAGAMGMIAFVLARKLLFAIAPRTPNLAAALAVVAAALATLHSPALVEARTMGGSTLGAILILGPLAVGDAGLAIAFAALGLAASYDIPTGLAAALGFAATHVFSGAKRPRGVHIAWAALGVVPMAFAWSRRGHVAIDGASAFAGWLGEGAHAGSLRSLLPTELGWIALGLAALGAVFVFRQRATRALGAGLGAVAIVGALASLVGAPNGPERFGAALLAMMAVFGIFSACGMAVVVDAVSRARIPMARASATMIVLLELAVPVRVADDASLAVQKMSHDGVEVWNTLVWGRLPFASIVLLGGPRPLVRARAAMAAGELRDDIALVATNFAGGRASGRELALEPRLAPLLRDLALYGAPEEFSISQLAATRPVVLQFDARWDKRFTRHLVSNGLLDRYFVEPRGPSDRTRAAVALTDAQRKRLGAETTLERATIDLVRAQALGACATGEHDFAEAQVTELLRLHANDSVGLELSKRLLVSHGSIDVRDLGARP